MNNLKTRQVELIESLKAKVELETYRMARIEKLSEGVNLEAIEAALATLGLTKVREANVQFSTSTSTKEEIDNQKMTISYRLQSNCTKIKPVMHKGYDKNGRGRNHTQLIDRAEKVETLISAKLNLECSVNQYGMEVKYATNSFDFSVDLYIK